MDNNEISDPLNSTAPLPELSFEDLLETSKSDSLIQSLDESLDVQTFNDGGNNHQVNYEFVERKNYSLNTPGPKPPPVKIIDNQKLVAALLPVPLKGRATTSPSHVVAKASTSPITQSAKTTAMGESSPGTFTSTDSKTKELLHTSVFKVTHPKFDGESTVPGNSSDSKKVTGAATLTTIDGKAAVKTADGKILFIQKASAGGNSTARVGQLRLQSAMTSGNLSKSAALVTSKNLKSIGASTMTVGVKMPTTTVTASIGSCRIKSIEGTVAPPTRASNNPNEDLQTTLKSDTTINDKTMLPTVPSPKMVSNKTNSVGPTTFNIVGAKPVALTKMTSKPVQIQIVRTADGKLLKLNRTAPAADKETVASVTTTTPSNKTITKPFLSLKTTTNTTNSGQLILKTPFKKLSPDLLAKSINLKKLTASVEKSISGGITNVNPSANKIGQTVVKILSNTSITPTVSAATTKPAVSSEAVITKPSALPASTAAVLPITESKPTTQSAKPSELATPMPTGTSAKLAAGTAPMHTKILNKSTSVSNAGCINATSIAGRMIMQSVNGKQIVVTNQHLVKLSSKPSKSPSATSIDNELTSESAAASSALPGKLQAVQLTGNSGVKYVRVLQKGSTIQDSSAVTLNSKLVVAKPSSASAAAAATAYSKSNSSQAKSSTTGTTILNTTLHSTSVSTSSISTAGYKLLNSVPQKFTLVRSNQSGNGGTTKFLLKQSPGKDGPLSVVSMPPKKVSSTDGRLKVARSASTNVISSSSALENNMRKHKNSDTNMEIKNKTAQISPAGEISSEAASEDATITAPEPKRARYVFMPRTGVLQKSSGGGNTTASTGASISNSSQTKSGIRTGYTLQRLHGAPNVKGNQPSQAIGVHKSGKQMYSILRTSKSSSSMKSYVVCNTATGQKSITIRRPFTLPESVIGKSSRKFITSADLERREKLTQAGVVRTVSAPVKYSMKPQYESLKQNVSASSSPSTTLISATSATTSTTAVALIAGPSTVTNATYDSNALASRRKHCNCSKSQCLKLYCDCFANGEFCQDCTCKDCFNNLQYEDERQRAIKSCLDRNPSAFKPKITARQHSDMRLHNKGCNCKRSGCLKNYCECYEAKIPCSSICKCVGCRNMEDRPDVDMDSMDCKTFSGLSTDKRKSQIRTDAADPDVIAAPATNNFVTEDVIDATIMCMISQLVECENQEMVENDIEKQIMEELGRCLVEIIDFSIRNSDSFLLEDTTKVS